MIMAGGGGTRFWPRSRSKRPKQFLCFNGERSLLQATYDRVSPIVSPDKIWVITGEKFAEEVGRQLPDLPPTQIVGEPVGRDTAACVALGSQLIAQRDSTATIAVMPADHVIEPEREFQRTLNAASQFCNDHPNNLFTFGITPSYPATGYGYIQRGESIDNRQGIACERVEAFREKPDSESAERFFQSGDYYWNSGIFLWKAETILGELSDKQPLLYDAARKIADAWDSPSCKNIFAAEYETLEKISIDYAVMEDAAKDSRVMVVRAPYQWDDVGSWLALERRNPQDAFGNTVQGLHAGLRTSHSVIVSEPHHLIATIGLSNLLVIQDGNVTLVADRREEEAVKQLVEQLKQNGLQEFL